MAVYFLIHSIYEANISCVVMAKKANLRKKRLFVVVIALGQRGGLCFLTYEM